MNKYEKKGDFSPIDRKSRLEFNQNFTAFREIVLNNKDYELGKAKDIVDSLDSVSARKLFEEFNSVEGALPDNLALEYLKLVYGPENLEKHLLDGEDLYEAISKISTEVRSAKISLNPELVNRQIEQTKKTLEAAKEDDSDVD